MDQLSSYRNISEHNPPKNVRTIDFPQNSLDGGGAPLTIMVKHDESGENSHFSINSFYSEHKLLTKSFQR
jgi:hypothetical protein